MLESRKIKCILSIIKHYTSKSTLIFFLCVFELNFFGCFLFFSPYNWSTKEKRTRDLIKRERRSRWDAAAQTHNFPPAFFSPSFFGLSVIHPSSLFYSLHPCVRSSTRFPLLPLIKAVWLETSDTFSPSGCDDLMRANRPTEFRQINSCSPDLMWPGVFQRGWT